MIKFAFLALFLVELAGCASTSQYGNFIQHTTDINDKKIVDDILKKLTTLYPPASTQFDFKHTTPDFFGTYLIESMRANGYAVLEFTPEPVIGINLIEFLHKGYIAPKPTLESNAAVVTANTAAPYPSGLPLSYILDKAKDSDMYRVTLMINSQQSLDRLYQLQDGTIYPASYWVRKN